MKKNSTDPWVRLAEVIWATDHNINSFARYIGLPRGENLYQIQRGNNGISLDVARRIHARCPEYSISWLMYGDEWDRAQEEDARAVVKIPLYRDLWERDFDLAASGEEQLVISASVANGAQFAVPYMDDILNPYLRNSILLLRAPQEDKIVSGNIYFVATKTTRDVPDRAGGCPQSDKIATEDDFAFGVQRCADPQGADHVDVAGLRGDLPHGTVTAHAAEAFTPPGLGAVHAERSEPSGS